MKINKQQLIGFAGVCVLAVGLFVPIINVPLMGERTIFEVGDFNGMLDYSLNGIAYGLVALIVASVLLIVLNYCRGLLIVGLIALSVFALTLKQFNDVAKMLHDNVASNFIMSVTGTTVDEGNMRWGWFFLFGGALVLIATSFLKSQPKEGLK